MRKQWSIAILALCMLWGMPMSVCAQEKGLQLEIEIPSTHTVTIENGAHGSITPNGSIAVNRLEEQTYHITPDFRYGVEHVSYNGEDVTEQLLHGSYTAPGIYEDTTLVVSYQALTKRLPQIEEPIHWNPEQECGVTIPLDADFGEVTRVVIDDETLSPEAYSVTNQPPELTIAPEILAELGEGEYTVLIESGTYYMEVTVVIGQETAQTSTVAIATATTTTALTTTTKAAANTTISQHNSPKTGELMGMGLVGLLGISGIGVLCTYFGRRKNHDENTENETERE